MKTNFILFSLVSLIVLLLASTFFIFEERLFAFQSRATVRQVDGANSLAISVPNCVPADKTSITRLQAYCLNPRGLGEPGIVVSVKPTGSAQDLEIRPIQGTTDEMGKAIFDLTSQTEGVFDLTITCGDTIIKTDHKACFTKG